LTVPRQFIVLIRKMSHMFGDETKYSMYTLCPTLSVAHFLSLCDECQLLHLPQMDVAFEPVAYKLRELMSFSDMCQFLAHPSAYMYTVV
jgi:hypothetical protein